MSRFAKAPAMSDDSDRMGKIARPMGQEGSMDNGQGSGTRAGALSGAVAVLKKQVARGAAAPTVGGRKMTDY
jgi:hypothetical protein